MRAAAPARSSPGARRRRTGAAGTASPVREGVDGREDMDGIVGSGAAGRAKRRVDGAMSTRRFRSRWSPAPPVSEPGGGRHPRSSADAQEPAGEDGQAAAATEGEAQQGQGADAGPGAGQGAGPGELLAEHL